MKPLPASVVDQLIQEFDVWIAGLESRSPNTARSYKYAVERFLEHLANGEFSNESVSEYLRSLTDLAPASRAHHISAVRSFLKWARYQSILDERPEHLLVRPRVTVTSYGRYLTLEELRRLVAAAGSLSPRHLAAVVTLALTGLRVSELTRAEWRDLFADPEGRVIRKSGCGGFYRAADGSSTASQSIRSDSACTRDATASSRRPITAYSAGSKLTRSTAGSSTSISADH